MRSGDVDSVVCFLFHPTYKNQEETQLRNILALGEVYFSLSEKNSEASLRCLATLFTSALKNKILHYGPKGRRSTTSARNMATSWAVTQPPLPRLSWDWPRTGWIDGWMNGFQKLKWRFIFRAKEDLKNACLGWNHVFHKWPKLYRSPRRFCPHCRN